MYISFVAQISLLFFLCRSYLFSRLDDKDDNDSRQTSQDQKRTNKLYTVFISLPFCIYIPVWINFWSLANDTFLDDLFFLVHTFSFCFVLGDSFKPLKSCCYCCTIRVTKSSRQGKYNLKYTFSFNVVDEMR